MNAFLHNSIADMPGPEFLLLCGLVIAAALRPESPGTSPGVCYEKMQRPILMASRLEIL